jgi:hypothetical protein
MYRHILLSTDSQHLRRALGKNQARKKSYAALNPRSAKSFMSGNDCLAINAAIKNLDGPNAPWLVEIYF